MRRGWAQPLDQVLPAVARVAPGRVLGVDLRPRSGGGWEYEVLVLAPDGRYREVLLDARSREVIELRSR